MFSSSSSSRIIQHPLTSSHSTSFSSSSSFKFSKGFDFFSRNKNKRIPTVAIRAVTNDVWSSNHHALPARKIRKSPEPPWPIYPPPQPENPFTDRNMVVAVPVGIGIPISIRLVQMKKRLEHVAPPLSLDDLPENPPVAVAKAVSALLFMIEELQKNLNDGGGDLGDFCDGKTIDRVCRDRRDCFSWLFRRVFANSPNLVPLILTLLASFVTISAEKIATNPVTLANLVAEIQEEVTGKSSLVGSFCSWYDIGIKEGSAHVRKKEEEEETSEERRRRAYERSIAEGEANSLILCNYAQFLNQVDRDHERAEKYFRLAAMVEPKDAEAISKYAFFLWEQRGDVSKAEDLFLEAIDVEPESFYHCRNYATFLWETGAEDTCFPLSSSPPFSC